MNCLIVIPPQDEQRVPIKLDLSSLEVVDATNNLLLPGLSRLSYISSAAQSMRSMARTPQNMFCATPLTFCSTSWSPRYTPRALFSRTSEWETEDAEGPCLLGTASSFRPREVTRPTGMTSSTPEPWWSEGYCAPSPFGSTTDAESRMPTSRRQLRRQFRKNKIQAGQKSGLGLRDDVGTYTLDSVMHQSLNGAGATVSAASSGDPVDPFKATTLMVRNLPRRKTRDEIEELLLESGFQDQYDFVFLPFCFYSNRNYGYAFINFISSCDAMRFQETWHKKRLFAGRKQRNVNVTVAEVQGKEANIQLSIRHQRLYQAE